MLYTVMKKFLLMMLAVFAYTSVNAVKFVKVDDNNYTLVIEGSSDAKSFEKLGTGEHGITDRDGLGTTDADYAKVTRIEFKGDFTSGWSSGWLTNSSANEPTNIKVIDMSGANFYSANEENISWSLREYNNLEKIIWPTAGHIIVLPQHAVWNCGIKQIKIPGYIKKIKANAIEESSDHRALESVIFEEYLVDGVSAVDMEIEAQAFQNCYNLYDVYIETLGTLDAAYNAFPFWVSNSHTDGTRRLGTLHFPEEKVEEYVNLNHTLDLATAEDDGRFQAWLSAHASQASQAANGWWEWVNNAPVRDYAPEPYPKFIKTFSHPTLSFIPGEGVKAYIVTSITPSGDNFVMNLKRVNVIPAGTGVILYGEANAKTSDGGKTYAMTVVKYVGPGAFNRSGDYADYYNLLEPTSPAGDESGAGVDVEPYEMEGGVVAWRNFGMGPFSVTVSGVKYGKEHGGKYGNYACEGHDANKGERVNGDFVGFFRLKKSHIAANKAYLRLKASEYTDANGGEVIVSTDENTAHQSEATIKKYQLEYRKGQSSATPLTWSQLVTMNLWQNAVWEKDWGVRDFGSGNANRMVTFDGEPATDGIQLVIAPAEEAEDGAIYNLQGVEVTNPTKGVYIKNGKKFVVK